MQAAVQSAVILLLDGGGWCPLGKGAWALPLGSEEPSVIATLRWLERLGGTEVCWFLSARFRGNGPLNISILSSPLSTAGVYSCLS
jgi:hypothetical protein